MPIRVPSRSRFRKYGYVTKNPCIGFTTSTSYIPQGTTSVTLTVVHSGTATTTKSFSVDYSTQDGTAVAGTNYTASSGTLTWEVGDSVEKTITITGIDPGEAELTFSVVLSNPIGAHLCNGTIVYINGDGDSTTVTVNDENDITVQEFPIFGALVYNTGTNTSDIDETWNTEVYDITAWHSIDSNTERFTSPSVVDLVRVVRGPKANVSGGFIAEVKKNGSHYYGSIYFGSGNNQNGANGSSASAPTAVNSGDYFTSVVSVDTDGSGENWFAIERMEPSTKYAIAYTASNLSGSSTSTYTLSWEATSVDTDSFWSAGTPSRLTVPEDGIYIPRLQTRLNTTADQNVIRIRKNGSDYAGSPEAHQVTLASNIAGAPVSVSAGDYFEGIIFFETAGTMLGNVNTWMSLESVPSTYKRVLARHNNTQLFTSGVEQALEFPLSIYDTDSIQTNNTTFTVPAGVTYAKVMFNTFCQPNGNTHRARVTLNGSQVPGMPYEETKTVSTDWMNGEGAWVQVSEGDTIQVLYRMTITFNLTSSNSTWVAILLQ